MLIGQNDSDYFIENYYKLTGENFQLEKQSFTKSQMALIQNIITDTSNYFCVGDEFKEEHYKHFHFVDLDGDNDLDLVFSGRLCPGFESESVLVFINHKRKYELQLSARGRIAEITREKSLVVYAYPCCASVEHKLSSYSIHKNKITAQTNVKLFDLSFFADSSNPDIFIPNKLIKTQTVKVKDGTALYLVSKERFIDLNFFDSIQADFVFSQPNEPVTVFSRHVDNNGDVWLYCKIRNRLDTTDAFVMLWLKGENSDFQK